MFRRWRVAVALLAVAALVVLAGTTTSIAQDRNPAGPKEGGPGSGPWGVRNNPGLEAMMLAEIGTTTVPGVYDYAYQYKETYTGWKKDGTGPGAGHVFTGSPLISSHPPLSAWGYAYCYIQIYEKSARMHGKVPFDLFVNGRRVARMRGAWGTGGMPSASATFGLATYGIGPGDIVHCRAKLPKKMANEIEDGWEFYFYSEIYDYD